MEIEVDELAQALKDMLRAQVGVAGHAVNTGRVLQDVSIAQVLLAMLRRLMLRRLMLRTRDSTTRGWDAMPLMWLK